MRPNWLTVSTSCERMIINHKNNNQHEFTFLKKTASSKSTLINGDLLFWFKKKNKNEAQLT